MCAAHLIILSDYLCAIDIKYTYNLYIIITIEVYVSVICDGIYTIALYIQVQKVFIVSVTLKINKRMHNISEGKRRCLREVEEVRGVEPLLC